MNNSKAFFIITLAALLNVIVFCNSKGQNAPVRKKAEMNIASLLDPYDVSWDTPGPTSMQSMPIGNGDIALNVWVEPNGDLCFLIAKTDAWGAASKTERNNWVKDGGVLMKLGKVRVSMSPSPLVQGVPFSQVLKLHNGEIVVKEGDAQLRVWVDANHPIIRVETKSAKPVDVKVTLNDWRTGNGDTFVHDKASSVTWYHQNPDYADPHLRNFVFGATIKGANMISKDDTTLQSGTKVKAQLISVYPLTTNNLNATQWLAAMKAQAEQNDAVNWELSRVAHQQWWDKFWHRSWIFINSADEATTNMNRGYILQRFVTACAGRGAYPIKFNGSLFVVDNPQYKRNRTTVSIDADYREWGGQYWFQNTRAMYWPRLMAGDFDEMLPLFNMYAKILPGNKELVKKYYNHDGAYFRETSPFWGDLPYMGPEVKEDWTGHYFTPILEMSMMMLDYYQYTGDKKFAKEIMLPIASAGLEFFDKHFKRDAQGKLLLDPDNSIEQYWKVHDPAPDIAGLNAITTRMLALPDDMTDAASRANWKRLQGELPPLPTGKKNGKEILYPYTTDTITARPRNSENPELYAIYPFRLYGLGKPNLDLAVYSFNERKMNRQKGCWVQDPIQAAMLGLTDVAKTYTSFALTRKDPALKFPAFWVAANDYAPDEDNGGNGENGLQQMLMQVDGKKIMLLAAWPKDWGNTAFKLNAPYNTTVQGKVVDGKLTDLVVIPASRKADVIDMSKQ